MLEPDDWKKHVDAELLKLRDSLHGLRSDVSNIQLGFNTDIAAMRLEIAKSFATVEVALAKMTAGNSLWATVGTTLVAAVPAVCVLIWWLVSHTPPH